MCVCVCVCVCVSICVCVSVLNLSMAGIAIESHTTMNAWTMATRAHIAVEKGYQRSR